MFCLYYVIKQGDTLYSISRKYNVDVNTIIMANPFINVYNLQPGDTICLPCIPNNRYTYFTTYLVEDGDTLGSVASKHEINIADLLEINDIYIYRTVTRLHPVSAHYGRRRGRYNPLNIYHISIRHKTVDYAVLCLVLTKDI